MQTTRNNLLKLSILNSVLLDYKTVIVKGGREGVCAFSMSLFPTLIMRKTKNNDQCLLRVLC